MSLLPTQVPMSPEVMSVSMILGTPKGRARITRVAVDVPTDPAQDNTPSHSLREYSSRILAAPARPTRSLASARGAASTSWILTSVQARTSWRETSAQSTAPPRLRSMIMGLPPWAATISARNLTSAPLVLHMPVQMMVGLLIGHTTLAAGES